MPQFTISKRLQKRMAAFERQLPKVTNEVAKESRLWFRKSFNLSGFIDNSLNNWQRRKKYGRGNNHRLLWKSGALRNSMNISGWALRRTITSGLDYSSIHNYGGRGLAWGKHPFTMPKRKFMGESAALHKRMQRLIIQRLRIVDKIIG